MSDATAAAYVAKTQVDDGRAVDQLLAEYRGGYAELQSAVAGLSEEQLRSRPVPGRWSTLELLGHLADCEQMYAERIKRTLGSPRPLLLGMDPTEYAGPLHSNERPPELVMDLFRVTRAECAAMLTRCDSGDWLREAVHSETGVVTLRQLVLHPCRHLRHHLPFFAEKRTAMDA